MAYYAEPYSSRKRRSKKTILYFLAGLCLVLAIPAFLYGPGLYLTLSGDPLLRLEKHATEFETELRAGGKSPADLYDAVQDSRRVLGILEKDNPAQAELHFYRGLFHFYELLARVPINGDSAVRLIGRLYLPQEPEDSPLAGRADMIPIPDLGQKISLSMRRALALDPDLRQAAVARLTIAYGDLIFTARTDPVLLEYLKTPAEELPEFFRPYRTWMSLVLLGMMGKGDELEAFLDAQGRSGADNTILHFTAPHRDLARSFGNFYARNYIKALQQARQVKAEASADRYLRAEATRMEGEIFYVQRGPAAARPYFLEALELSGAEDQFLKERLATIGE